MKSNLKIIKKRKQKPAKEFKIIKSIILKMEEELIKIKEEINTIISKNINFKTKIKIKKYKILKKIKSICLVKNLNWNIIRNYFHKILNKILIFIFKTLLVMIIILNRDKIHIINLIFKINPIFNSTKISKKIGIKLNSIVILNFKIISNNIKIINIKTKITVIQNLI